MRNNAFHSTYLADRAGHATISPNTPCEAGQFASLTLTYTAGYSVIPNEVTMAALALIGYWYQNPNAADAVSISSAPLSLEYILDIISTRSMLR